MTSKLIDLKDYANENLEWNREENTLHNFSLLKNLPFPTKFKKLLWQLQNGTSINKHAWWYNLKSFGYILIVVGPSYLNLFKI